MTKLICFLVLSAFLVIFFSVLLSYFMMEKSEKQKFELQLLHEKAQKIEEEIERLEREKDAKI